MSKMLLSASALFMGAAGAGALAGIYTAFAAAFGFLMFRHPSPR